MEDVQRVTEVARTFGLLIVPVACTTAVVLAIGRAARYQRLRDREMRRQLVGLREDLAGRW